MAHHVFALWSVSTPTPTGQRTGILIISVSSLCFINDRSKEQATFPKPVLITHVRYLGFYLLPKGTFVTFPSKLEKV